MLEIRRLTNQVILNSCVRLEYSSSQERGGDRRHEARRVVLREVERRDVAEHGEGGVRQVALLHAHAEPRELGLLVSIITLRNSSEFFS